MKHVPLHIDFLLTRHQCVAVAGLGAFLVNDVAACYDKSKETFLPPSRMLGFNPELTISDGLLAESIARREGLSLDEAAKIVTSEITEFYCTLTEQGSVIFGRLGTFNRLKDGIMTFEPSDSAMCMQRFQGLSALDIKPIAEDSELSDNADARRSAPRFSFMIKAVASLLLLLVLGGLITATTGLVDGKSVERAMLSAFAGAQHADEIQESAAIDLSRAIVLNIAAPAEEVPEVAEETVAPQPTPFLLVVASLESASSARRHIGNDADLKYVDMGGKYRVYVDSFPTAQAASAALPSYQTKYPNVWVCRR